jgi:hypothetical protein
MSSLFDPTNLSDKEFVRIADAELLNGPLPLEWQLNAIDRLARHYPRDRHVPAATEGQPYGRK